MATPNLFFSQKNTTMNIHFTCPETLGRLALNSKIFQDWEDRLDPRIGVTKVTITNVDFRSSPSVENVLFIRLRVECALSPRGQVVELRGGSVAMLVNLKCTEDGKIYTVLVKQARTPTGIFEFVEIPAGMIDGGNFLGAASREIKEELGITILESELVNITGTDSETENGIFLSPGLLDEACMFYLAEREVSLQELNELRGKTTGVEHEGEFITLLIVPFDEMIKKTRDSKTLIAWSLYHLHKKHTA